MPLYLTNSDISTFCGISKNSVAKFVKSKNIVRNRFLPRPHFRTDLVLKGLGYPNDLIREIVEDREPLHRLQTVKDFIEHFGWKANQEETVRRHVRSGTLPAIRILDAEIRFRPFDITAIQRG